MDYYVCKTCPDHTTYDHENHGLGPCLISGCLCGLMVPGEIYVRPQRVKKSEEEVLKALEARKNRGITFPGG